MKVFMKALIVLLAAIVVHSTSMAQSDSAYLGDKAELARLEKNIEISCSEREACINSAFEILGRKTLPGLFNEGLALVAESKRLTHDPEAARVDDFVIRRNADILKSQMEFASKYGLDASAKTQILRWLKQAKADNKRLQAFVASLKK